MNPLLRAILCKTTAMGWASMHLRMVLILLSAHRTFCLLIRL